MVVKLDTFREHCSKIIGHGVKYYYVFSSMCIDFSLHGKNRGFIFQTGEHFCGSNIPFWSWKFKSGYVVQLTLIAFLM